MVLSFKVCEDLQVTEKSKKELILDLKYEWELLYINCFFLGEKIVLICFGWYKGLMI
jgi:hypothetical protein